MYGTEPPTDEFRWEDVQAEVDREPTRDGGRRMVRVGTVESWTTPFDRTGAPEKAFLAVRTPEDARVLAVIPTRRRPRRRSREDIAGAKVAVNADGTATLA